MAPVNNEEGSEGSGTSGGNSSGNGNNATSPQPQPSDTSRQRRISYIIPNQQVQVQQPTPAPSVSNGSATIPPPRLVMGNQIGGINLLAHANNGNPLPAHLGSLPSGPYLQYLHERNPFQNGFGAVLPPSRHTGPSALAYQIGVSASNQNRTGARPGDHGHLYRSVYGRGGVHVQRIAGPFGDMAFEHIPAAHRPLGRNLDLVVGINGNGPEPGRQPPAVPPRQSSLANGVIPNSQIAQAAALAAAGVVGYGYQMNQSREPSPPRPSTSQATQRVETVTRDEQNSPPDQDLTEALELRFQHSFRQDESTGRLSGQDSTITVKLNASGNETLADNLRDIVSNGISQYLELTAQSMMLLRRHADGKRKDGGRGSTCEDCQQRNKASTSAGTATATGSDQEEQAESTEIGIKRSHPSPSPATDENSDSETSGPDEQCKSQSENQPMYKRIKPSGSGVVVAAGSQEVLLQDSKHQNVNPTSDNPSMADETSGPSSGQSVELPLVAGSGPWVIRLQTLPPYSFQAPVGPEQLSAAHGKESGQGGGGAILDLNIVGDARNSENGTTGNNVGPSGAYQRDRNNTTGACEASSTPLASSSSDCSPNGIVAADQHPNPPAMQFNAPIPLGMLMLGEQVDVVVLNDLDHEDPPDSDDNNT